MKKYLLSFLLIIIFPYIIRSQQMVTNLDPNLLTYPASPEAAKLQTYGNVGVNMAFGQLNHTIPLFNGVIGDFSVPINLSYNYSGNKLEETPSIIGLGWQLNIGGSISREVRALPDSYNNNYYSSSSYFKSYVWNQYFNNQTISEVDARHIAEGKYDSEPDKYSVSVNGIHFSFKIGLDGTPVFLTRHDYKIQINRKLNNSNEIESFILKDTNGNQYYFQDIETTEQVSGMAFSDPNSASDLMHPAYTSTWQLTKIITNNNSIINYNYAIDDFNSYNFYCTATYPGSISNPPFDWTTKIDEGCNKFLIKRKLLTSIVSNQFAINFNIATLNNVKVYNQITVKNSKNNLIHQFDFSYTGYRNSLININKNNEFFQGFEYIPGINEGFINSIYTYPKNQDKWGYANGAQNNYTINIPNTGFKANREPSFSDTSSGALKKITYQTGGTTEIFYEQNQVYTTEVSNNITPNTRLLLKFKSDNVPDAPASKEEVFTKTFLTNTVATLSHKIESHYAGFINMDIRRIPDLCQTDTYNMAAYYYNKVPQQRSSENNNVPIVCPVLHDALNDGYSGASAINSYDSAGKFVIPAGTYEFKFQTDQNRFKDVKGEFQLDFYDPEINTNIKPTALSGGIRVQRTLDTDNNGLQTSKFYDYRDENNIPTGYSGITLTDSYIYRELQGYAGTGNSPILYISDYRDVTVYNSKSFNQLLGNSSPVNYTTVKEYTTYNDVFTPADRYHAFPCKNCSSSFYEKNYDDSAKYSYLLGPWGTTNRYFAQGYKISRFIASSNSSTTTYPFIPNGNYITPPITSDVKIFSNSNSLKNETLLYSESSKYDSYSGQVTSNYPVGLKLGYKIKKTNVRASESNFNPQNFYFLLAYNETDSENKQYSQITKEYLKNQVIIKKDSIIYDSHLQKSLITSADSQNNIKTTELFYPYNFGDAVATDMVSKNVISPTVQITNKKNGILIDSYKYDFTLITGNLFKPRFFLQNKGNETLERKKQYGYDTFGNVNNIGVIIKDSAVPNSILTNANVTVIWGYQKSLPIAKIEGSFTTLPSTLITATETASDNGTESSLLTALTALRNSPELANAAVTTYTHIPLVGISTTTNPRGITTSYSYDAANRLKLIRDENSNILQEYCYGFKGQMIDCPTGFKNSAKSQTFVKNNCSGNSVGSSVIYTVPQGTYVSATSQADAEAMAQADVNNSGQNYANGNGTCITTFTNIAVTRTYTKNDCTGGGVGSSLPYTIAAGTFTTTISQEQANIMAQNKCDVWGQANANQNGTCTFTYLNTMKSGVIAKNNCSTGVGSTVTYTVAAGTYTSTISQADADMQAQNNVDANVQSYANTNGSCGFYNTATGNYYTRNNCGPGYTGSNVYYSVSAGTYFSTTSQKAANLLALSDVVNNGQAYANANGTCTYNNQTQN